MDDQKYLKKSIWVLGTTPVKSIGIEVRKVTVNDNILNPIILGNTPGEFNIIIPKQKVRDMIKLLVDMSDDIAISSIWSVEDFETIAQKEEEEYLKEKGERVYLYDRAKFSTALKLMCENHDADIGINWDTIYHYLEEHCEINQEITEQ